MLLHAVVQLALDLAAVVIGGEDERPKPCVMPGLHSVSLDRFRRHAAWASGTNDQGGRLPVKTSTAALTASLLVLALTPFAAVATAGPQRDADVRFSTFNASLNRNSAGQLVADLSTPNNAQAATVAEIIQRARPDVLLINEFDFDPARRSSCSRTTTCRCPTTAPTPIDYPYRYHRAVEHGHPVRLRPQQQRRRSAGPTMPSASASSPASSGWPSTRCIRST